MIDLVQFLCQCHEVKCQNVFRLLLTSSLWRKETARHPHSEVHFMTSRALVLDVHFVSADKLMHQDQERRGWMRSSTLQVYGVCDITQLYVNHTCILTNYIYCTIHFEQVLCLSPSDSQWPEAYICCGLSVRPRDIFRVKVELIIFQWSR